MSYRPWGAELDTTEQLTHFIHISTFFSIAVHHRMLTLSPWAAQEALVACPSCVTVGICHSQTPAPSSPGTLPRATTGLSCFCESVKIFKY